MNMLFECDRLFTNFWKSLFFRSFYYSIIPFKKNEICFFIQFGDLTQWSNSLCQSIHTAQYTHCNSNMSNAHVLPIPIKRKVKIWLSLKWSGYGYCFRIKPAVDYRLEEKHTRKLFLPFYLQQQSHE